MCNRYGREINETKEKQSKKVIKAIFVLFREYLKNIKLSFYLPIFL